MKIQQIPSLAFITAAIVLFAPDSRAEDTSSPDASYIYFTSPLPNAEFVDAPTTLSAQIGVYQGVLEEVANVELFVDDVSFASQECASGCTFTDIELDQGVHTLRAMAGNGTQDSIMVYVGEEAPSDTGDTGEDTGEDTTDDDEGTGDGAGEGNDEGGKGCEIGGSSTPWSLLALPALLLLPGLRRRRE